MLQMIRWNTFFYNYNSNLIRFKVNGKTRYCENVFWNAISERKKLFVRRYAKRCKYQVICISFLYNTMDKLFSPVTKLAIENWYETLAEIVPNESACPNAGKGCRLFWKFSRKTDMRVSRPDQWSGAVSAIQRILLTDSMWYTNCIW